MEGILKATLEVPYWCSFRVPTAVNVHPTYPVPPLTTIYGLLAAAMGWGADNYSYLEKMKIGLILVEKGERIEGYNKIIKWDRRDREMRTLVMRHKLIKPIFELLVKGEEALLRDMAKALGNPHFPLYLGESDDLIEVKDVGVFPLVELETEEIDSILPQDSGRPVSQVELVFLPTGFLWEEKGKNRLWSGVNYKGYYIASKIKVEKPLTAYLVDNKRVVL
ncbi:MAG: CRISPR-associated protein Cas5 [Bacillota bacterium]